MDGAILAQEEMLNGVLSSKFYCPHCIPPTVTLTDTLLDSGGGR